MDISETTAPRSDQQNYDDYIAGPKTVTVTEGRKGTAEQPVEIHLAEFPGRPYKPSKSMRRVIVAAWGAEASAYTGRRLTLYGDPEVTFGREKVGGIKISHLSHIDKPLSIALTVTRGKRAPFTVMPLPDTAPTVDPGKVVDAIAAIHKAPNITELVRIETYANGLGIGSDKGVQAALAARRNELEVFE